MAGFSNYWEGQILLNMFKGTTLTTPTTLYFSLHTSDPGETGGNELTIGTYNYTRATKATDDSNTAGNFTDPTAGTSVTSAVEVTFPENEGTNWGAVSHFGIWDGAATSDNFLAGGEINGGTAVTVSVNTQLRFPSGNLTLTLD
jgi:hypothetical protein